jgi:NarL family two-component system response regulator LiaR
VKVLVVDDDVLVSHSLKVLLSHEEGVQVIGTVVDGSRAIAACEKNLPDAVLMDIRMPGMDGIEATRRIKARWPQVRVMILTTFQDDQSIHSALRAGADGYLLKSTPSAGMAERLRALVAGTAVVDAAVLKRLSEPPRPTLPGLTARENDVAELVAQGMSNREIAEHLLISEGTARNILSGILEKLGLRDRTQLAIRYWKRGSGGLSPDRPPVRVKGQGPLPGR